MEKKNFFNSLLDKYDPKDTKAFCGIIGMFSLCFTAIVYHTDASLYALALTTAGSLGFSLGETIWDKIKNKNTDTTNTTQ